MSCATVDFLDVCRRGFRNQNMITRGALNRQAGHASEHTEWRVLSCSKVGINASIVVENSLKSPPKLTYFPHYTRDSLALSILMQEMNQGRGPQSLTYDIQLLCVNKPKNLDFTGWALLANAGPFRAVQGPFVYALTEIDEVPTDDTKGWEEREVKPLP